MRRVTVAVARLENASPAAADGLAADLAFCHPSIRGVGRIDPAAGTVELAVDGDDPTGDPELRRLVSRVVELSVSSYRFADAPPALWRRDAAARYAPGDPLRELAERWTRPLGPGQIALLGPASRLRTALDRRLERLSLALDAEPWHLPSIEQTGDLLVDSGYFASHPHHVCFAFHLGPHFDRVQRFAEQARTHRVDRVPAGELEPTGFILEPFVCHNVYRALRGGRLSDGLAVTALGNCYRYEGFRFEPLLRQWEFSMRELVLVGQPDWVRARRQTAIDLAKQLVEELDLDAAIEVATDPFFVSSAATARTFQMMQSTKLELRLRIRDGETTAATSFNLHGTHFTDPMDIRAATGGALLETSCVGSGIERWLAAFVCRWGANPEGWPML